MADNRSSGPSGATIALVGLLATPIVLFLVFWLVGSSGGSSGAAKTLPEVRPKGLQWARAEIKDAGFNKPEAYDSLGRDRSWRNDREWKVCFETPRAGRQPGNSAVKLGVVKVVESCPPPDQDQGVYEPAVKTMPDLTDRTAFVTSKILGPNASVRYIDRTDNSEVTRGLGDWRVCSQSPGVGERFDGLPVTVKVVRYEARC
jgi:hypothetical protein